MKEAAAQGNASAERTLGFLYVSGRGMPEDYAQAMARYKKSAAQGDAIAEDDIGYLYLTGRGVAKDYQTARGWFQKAAAQDDSSAETILGAMYAHGVGVRQDYFQAFIWYQKAATQGLSEAGSTSTASEKWSPWVGLQPNGKSGAINPNRFYLSASHLVFRSACSQTGKRQAKWLQEV